MCIRDRAYASRATAWRVRSASGVSSTHEPADPCRSGREKAFPLRTSASRRSIGSSTKATVGTRNTREPVCAQVVAVAQERRVVDGALFNMTCERPAHGDRPVHGVVMAELWRSVI